MALQLVRGGRFFSNALRLRPFLPNILVPVFNATISSSAGSESSSPLAAESLYALKEPLVAQNLGVRRDKPQLAPCARKLSTGSRRDGIQGVQNLVVPTIPKPREMKATEKAEMPIRVSADLSSVVIGQPITPDNEFARYHRHEMVPEVAPPTKHVVTTVLPDTIEGAEDALAEILEDISVEVKDYKTQEQYAKEHGKI